MLSVIIVAGGSSRRMGFDKILAPLEGRPVLAHSIAAFEVTASVNEIIVVGRVEQLATYQSLCAREIFTKVSAVIPGGERRQDSVRQGLERLQAGTDFIAVHDAARPLVRPDLIERIFQIAQEHGGAASAAPVADTLQRADDGYVVTERVERAHLFAVQTPQIFRRTLLKDAYDAVFRAGREVTDEISAVTEARGKVVLVPNDEPNFKITWPADLALAGFVLRQRAS